MRSLFWTLKLGTGFVLILSGCTELGYYRQAAAGQWALLRACRPVSAVLADPTTSSELRQRLETAQSLRAFASTELALPDHGSYQRYADLGRPWVVQNVFAAPELSLEPRRWCFPLIGCLSYRGYFDAKAAQRLAKKLRANGDDVYVADISAYSTLGWFDDPLLSTFIDWPIGRLADLIFHELAHQRLYVAGDTEFNEAFATAMGRLGAERWLAQHGTAYEREEYAVDLHRREQFLQLTADTREQLAAVYASSHDVATKRAEKRAILARLYQRYRELKRDWGGYAGYDRWFDQDLNNAKLAGVATYYQQVPAFLALFEQEGRDFAAFQRAAAMIGELPPSERATRLHALSASPQPVESASPLSSSDP